MKLAAIAALINGEVTGGDSREISRACGLESAGDGDISFVAAKDKKYAQAKAENSRFAQIGALIVGKDFDFADDENFQVALIKVENPPVAFAIVSQKLAPKIPLPEKIHPRAVIAESAKIGKNVALGAGAVVDDSAVIGDETVIGAGAVIGANCRIGARTIIYPNAVVYYDCEIGDDCIIHAGAVIGADGFGFQWNGEEHLKIPQVGKVIIGNKVEIGANATIDRARFDATRIGDDCKIDNLVHIAHNCEIGAHCIFAGLVGVSGSVKMGRGVVAGGQSGFADHLVIGDGARFFAKSGVMNDIPAGALCGGEPAMEYREGIRQYHNTRYAAKHFKDLEKRVEKLETEKSGNAPTP